MKLITKQVAEQMSKYPLYSQDGKGLEAVVTAKFFLQNFTWYVLEWDGDDTFFGVVDGNVTEYGYFSLRELESLRGMFGLKVERDTGFGPQTLREAGKSEPYLEDFVAKLEYNEKLELKEVEVM